MLDIDESAAKCFQWKAHLDEDYREELLGRCDLVSEYNKPVYPFECPKCITGFTKLSGLFQHVYSKACNQRMYKGKMGKLVRWLEVQHSTGGSK
jgi:hypothetical protein